jgi:hypothetical protein
MQRVKHVYQVIAWLALAFGALTAIQVAWTLTKLSPTDFAAVNLPANAFLLLLLALTSVIVWFVMKSAVRALRSPSESTVAALYRNFCVLLFFAGYAVGERLFAGGGDFQEVLGPFAVGFAFAFGGNAMLKSWGTPESFADGRPR